jgi:hypothetical protein
LLTFDGEYVICEIIKEECWCFFIGVGITIHCKIGHNKIGLKFPRHVVLDTMGIVYLQYQFQLGCDESFAKHLDIMKALHMLASNENKKNNF